MSKLLPMNKSSMSKRLSKRHFEVSALTTLPGMRPQIWGGRRLETLLHKQLPPDQLIGESWELSTHPYYDSPILSGPYTGWQLSEVWKQFSREIAGHDISPYAPFPLLIKYLDCHLPVSIQVHPNDADAQRLLGERNGKSECWLVLHSEPNAHVFAGFQNGVTEHDVRAAIKAGKLSTLLNSFHPEPGDCIPIPAGTVHSVGDGVLMLEVQQNSDATFRLDDWNRLGPDGKPRELHIEQSLESIDWTATAITPRRGVPQPGKIGVETLVTAKYFQIEKHTVTDIHQLATTDGMRAVSVVQGTGILAYTQQELALQLGDTFLLPASLENWEFRSNDTALELIVIQPTAFAEH